MQRHAIAIALSILLLAPATVALAAWSASGSGGGTGAAATMPAGNAPTARVSGSDVVLTWPAATFANGAAVAGYTLLRYDANGDAVPVGGSCAGTVTGTTCTDRAVPAGTWTYTDTPVQVGWTGAASPPSGPALVGS